ncbi:MAG: glutamate cyclase domain-containing protein [Gaiellaceae bacterium]
MSANGHVSFENLDRLITVEMRPPTLPQGLVPQLYAAARGEGGPIVQRIAVELASLEPGRIAIFTGVVIPPYLEVGEMDGPPGSGVLAAALAKLGHDVHLVVETEQIEAAKALCAVAGANEVVVYDLDGASDGDVEGYAGTLAAAVAVEKLSENAQGIRHSLLGTPLDSLDARTDRVFRELMRLGRPTVGIGDGGNEIGFAAISEDVYRILGDTTKCRCGCEAGLVAATGTRHMLPCAISNVGAYAVTAALALTVERPDLCPDATLLWALLEAGMQAGLLDGGTLDPEFVGDDGVPGSAVAAMVELIATIVSQTSRAIPERPF